MHYCEHVQGSCIGLTCAMFEDCSVHSVSHRSAPYNDSTRYTFTGATGRTEHSVASQPLSRKERYGARRQDTREALAFGASIAVSIIVLYLLAH